MVSSKATQVVYNCLDQALRETIHFWMECSRHEQLCLKNPCNFSQIVCCESYIAVRYNLLGLSILIDDVVNEYVCKSRCINCLSAGCPRYLLCHVLEKHYNAVLVTSQDRQVTYIVNADFLPAAIRNKKWL